MSFLYLITHIDIFHSMYIVTPTNYIISIHHQLLLLLHHIPIKSSNKYNNKHPPLGLDNSTEDSFSTLWSLIFSFHKIVFSFALLLGQHLSRRLSHLCPGQVNILSLREPRAHSHAQEIHVIDLGRHQMDLSTAIDPLQQLLTDGVLSLQAEAYQSHCHLSHNLKALVLAARRLKLLRKVAMPADVLLQVLHSVQTQDEPQLQGAEPASQWDLPVTVVRSGSLHVVLQIQRIDVKGIHDPSGILQPHRTAIKVHQHPLVGIEVERVRTLNALHQVPVLWTDERRSRISSVHMHPHVVLVAHRTNLVQFIKGARVGGAQSGHDVERNQTRSQVLNNGRIQGGTPHTVVLISWQRAQTNAPEETSTLHRGMGLGWRG